MYIQKEMFQGNKVLDKKVLNQDDESWRSEWKQMPEFQVENKETIKNISVSFETEEDMKMFSDLIGKNITMKTKGIFFPVIDKLKMEYVDES